MINIKFLKPFYTKFTGDKLRLVFAYQYLAIEKNNELFQFVPIEGKEMVVDIETMQIENLSEVFVFQRGNRFIRLPLYQLLLVSNVQGFILPIIESVKKEAGIVSYNSKEKQFNLCDESMKLIHLIEQRNIEAEIDRALDNQDRELFAELVTKLQSHNVTMYERNVVQP